jgi:hypothetical protein
VEWCKYLALTAHPLSRRAVGPKVKALSGQKPGKNWLHTFFQRHPRLKMGRASGLDLKRARAFNYPTVNCHFELLCEVMEEKDC